MSDVPEFAPVFDQGAEIKYGKHCWHERYCIEEQRRAVRCSICNAALDPFAILLELARGERVRDNLENAIKAKRETLRKLHDEERRVKARTRNARKKDADLAVASALKQAQENHERTVSLLLCARAEISSALKRLGRPGE